MTAKNRGRPTTRTPADPTPTATPAPAPAVNPRTAAADQLEALAAAGNLKAIRAIAEGMADQLRADAGMTTWPTVRGTIRTPCPNCAHSIRIALDLIDLGRGRGSDPSAYLEVATMDLTQAFPEPNPQITKGNAPAPREVTGLQRYRVGPEPDPTAPG